MPLLIGADLRSDRPGLGRGRMSDSRFTQIYGHRDQQEAEPSEEVVAERETDETGQHEHHGENGEERRLSRQCRFGLSVPSGTPYTFATGSQPGSDRDGVRRRQTVPGPTLDDRTSSRRTQRKAQNQWSISQWYWQLGQLAHSGPSNTFGCRRPSCISESHRGQIIRTSSRSSVAH